jgi:hypothetical protein
MALSFVSKLHSNQYLDLLNVMLQLLSVTRGGVEPKEPMPFMAGAVGRIWRHFMKQDQAVLVEYTASYNQKIWLRKCRKVRWTAAAK